MKLRILALCLALAGCFTPPHNPPPTGPTSYRDPAPTRGADDIRVSVPENEDDRRAERASAAARCAEYGRVEERRGDGQYACVRPSERNPGGLSD